MATISKADIGTGNTIQSEHITRIIDALNGTGSADVIATGSFTGSFNGFADTWTVQDLTVFGTASINYFESIYETSSIIFQSGSTKFGNSADDTHQFTGSVFIDGDTQILGNTTATGSFSGSFVGDGSGLDGVVATTLFALSAGSGISAFTFDGSSTQTINVSGSTALSADTVTKWTGDAFADTNITDNGVVVDINSNTTITGSLNVTGGITGSYTGSYTGSFVGDGSGLTGISVPSGVFGISDSSGVYTYYATLTLAMAAAVAGQTIEMFADVVETGAVTVVLKNGVNINFNGHTYTLDSATTDSCLLINSNVTASFFNGTVRRIGGTSGFNSYCLGGTGAVGSPRNIYSYGVKYENTFGIAVHNPGANSNMYNIDAYGVTYGIYNNSGNVYNSQGSATTGSGVHSQNGGKYFSCIGKSTSGDGVTGTGGQFISCTGFSSSGNGINFNGSFGLSCTGYSSTLDGIVSSGTATLTDCSGYSASRYGVSLTGTTAGSNIYGFSASNNGVRISSGSGSQIINSVKAISDLNIALFVLHNGTSVIVSDIYAHSKWNNTGGHAVQITGTSSNKILKGGTLIVTNSSANCIYSAAAQTWKYLQLAFIGATTPISANITQGQLNTHDNQGNILIG
jgi:hypothetical protein